MDALTSFKGATYAGNTTVGADHPLNKETAQQEAKRFRDPTNSWLLLLLPQSTRPVTTDGAEWVDENKLDSGYN